MVLSKSNKMKYIPAFALVLLFIGCGMTREVPDDRYHQTGEINTLNG